MPNFPHSYAETLTALPADLGEEGNAARNRLAQKGFVVLAGLTRYMAGAVSMAARQTHIREFCPNDASSKRFATEDSTEKWLGKHGGRGVFILGKTVADASGVRLAGYGWEGAGQTENMPAARTTFAVRITEEGRGQGAGVDLTRVIVAGARSMYGASGVWLETYGSNRGATRIYETAGFIRASDLNSEGSEPLSVACVRPTQLEEGALLPDGREVRLERGQTVVDDERWYYYYPDQHLPSLPH